QQLRETIPIACGPVSGRQLLAGLTEFDATFTDRDARAVTLEQSAGLPIGQALDTLTQARDEHAIIRLADGSSTTSWHRALERNTVEAFKTLVRERLDAIPGQVVQHATTTVQRQLKARGASLSAEQLEALELACGDRQVVMIQGQAGTGKSTLLQAVALSMAICFSPLGAT
ncbi:MAG: AAA family ATPase, partial [Actinomycetota bacterium]|nr:AAA family ATPase [Actinomycetota bacterium]